MQVANNDPTVDAGRNLKMPGGESHWLQTSLVSVSKASISQMLRPASCCAKHRCVKQLRYVMLQSSTM